MNHHFRFILKYIHYLLNAKTKHGVHSPFVFDLLSNVINDNSKFYVFDAIEDLRRKLLFDNRTIEVTDFGAGSHNNNSKKRPIKVIAKNAAKPEKYGQLLFRLVNQLKPATMLELGTSLGISTAYQASANADGHFITMEGCPQTGKIASENFNKLGLKNIEIVTGNFDNTLSQTLAKINRLDYVFFDGNHQKEPTINYFEQCLVKAHGHTLFVFDDIHWSKGMEEAWNYIKQHPQTTVAIDLFFIGLVFFRPQQAKENFVLRY